MAEKIYGFKKFNEPETERITLSAAVAGTTAGSSNNPGYLSATGLGRKDVGCILAVNDKIAPSVVPDKDGVKIGQSLAFLKSGTLLISGTVIEAGSIITTSAGTTVYTERAALEANATLSADGVLAPGSVIKGAASTAGSSIKTGSIINGTTYASDTYVTADMTVTSEQASRVRYYLLMEVPDEFKQAVVYALDTLEKLDNLIETTYKGFWPDQFYKLRTEGAK